MALYTIADPHLSLGEHIDKPMDVFGARWTSHAEKLDTRWRALVGEEDTVVIPGDISWAMRLDGAEEDLRFIHALPGKKIIGKGNHDLWWSTRSKVEAFLREKGFDSIRLLYNDAVLCDGIIVAGTRGWYQEINMPAACDYAKIAARECGRLRFSLTEARALHEQSGAPIVAFTHFPPVWREFRFESFLDVLEEYHVSKCYFGHIHGVYGCPPKTVYRNIEFELISADYLDFTPRRVFPPAPEA